MNILHIIGGGLNGGAARGAIWLHNALCEKGRPSKLLTPQYENKRLGIESITQGKAGKAKLFTKKLCDEALIHLFKRKDSTGSFSTGLFGFDIRKHPSYRWADIIHLHWVNASMLNIKILSKINKPIIWTMRDMWPITGGCHYSQQCTRYSKKCGKCPQLKGNLSIDLSSIILRRKKKYLPKNVHMVAISNWIAEIARCSSLCQGMPIAVIHNAINTKAFFPVPKKAARQILGLPLDKKIILTGAENNTTPSKGFKYFLEAVDNLNNNCLCLFFGEMKNEKAEGISLGYLHDTISLRLAYSAADVFVAPSTQEAFGKTIIESMACETPVVAFDSTGPKDIITHRQNGYLAAPFQTTDLAHGISWILNDATRLKDLSQAARKTVESKFNILRVAETYLKLYEKVLAKN